MSSRKTIEGNHKNALDDVHSFGGRNVWAASDARRQNPFSKGSSEARALADGAFLGGDGKIVRRQVPTFGLDMISDSKNIYWAAAGDIAAISRRMTIEADRLAAFEVAPTRYVIVSPGGPPASQTVYSTQNCFDMALSGAIEDGGEALIVSPCDGRPDVPEETRGLAPDDKAKRLFYDNLAKMKDWPIEKSAKWINDHFELYLWKTDRVLKLMNRRRVKIYLYSTLPDEKVKAIGFTPVKDVQGWIDVRCGQGARIRVIDDGNKMLVMGNEGRVMHRC
jgi:nickel-dependent lactate racemase